MSCWCPSYGFMKDDRNRKYSITGPKLVNKYFKGSESYSQTKRTTYLILRWFVNINHLIKYCHFDAKTGSTKLKLDKVITFCLENSFLALAFKFDQPFINYPWKWCNVVLVISGKLSIRCQISTRKVKKWYDEAYIPYMMSIFRKL